MHVLRVAQKCYPDVTGDGPYHVHAMSRDQTAMGHDVTVLTVRSDPSLPDREERDGYTIRWFVEKRFPLETTRYDRLDWLSISKDVACPEVPRPTHTPPFRVKQNSRVSPDSYSPRTHHFFM